MLCMNTKGYLAAMMSGRWVPPLCCVPAGVSIEHHRGPLIRLNTIYMTWLGGPQLPHPTMVGSGFRFIGLDWGKAVSIACIAKQTS